MPHAEIIKSHGAYAQMSAYNGATKFSITTLSIMTLSINDTQNIGLVYATHHK
jgi:hypothetical protein